MTHIDPLTNSPEIKSDIRSPYDLLNSQAAFSKKKVKIGPFQSKCHRHPGESKPMSAKTAARKQETAARIARIQKAGVKYRTLLAHPEAKIQYKNSEAYIQPREKGKFLPKIVF